MLNAICTKISKSLDLVNYLTPNPCASVSLYFLMYIYICNFTRQRFFFYKFLYHIYFINKCTFSLFTQTKIIFPLISCIKFFFFCSTCLYTNIFIQFTFLHFFLFCTKKIFYKKKRMTFKYFDFYINNSYIYLFKGI